MTAFADLEALIGPPAVTPPAVDRPALEAVTGLEFPADHKALCARYGMLEVNAFMSVLHLCVAPDITTWDRNARDDLETLRELTEDSGVIYLLDDSGGEVEAAPYPYHPEPCGLFPWGSTENGDTLLWLTDPDPGRWTVVVTDGGGWWNRPVAYTWPSTHRRIGCPAGEVKRADASHRPRPAGRAGRRRPAVPGR